MCFCLSGVVALLWRSTGAAAARLTTGTFTVGLGLPSVAESASVAVGSVCSTGSAGTGVSAAAGSVGVSADSAVAVIGVSEFSADFAEATLARFFC